MGKLAKYSMVFFVGTVVIGFGATFGDKLINKFQSVSNAVTGSNAPPCKRDCLQRKAEQAIQRFFGR